MSKLVRSASVAIEAVAGQGVGGASVTGVYQGIVDFVSMTLWDDGQKRRACSFSVFYEGGAWKAWINDKEQDRTACVAAGSFPTLLQAIERVVVTDQADWRRPTPKGEQGRRK